MESNPGTFFVSVRRIKPVPEDDTVEIKLSLGDARRLCRLMLHGHPNNQFNTIWALRCRLLNALTDQGILAEDLG